VDVPYLYVSLLGVYFGGMYILSTFIYILYTNSLIRICGNVVVILHIGMGVRSMWQSYKQREIKQGNGDRMGYHNERYLKMRDQPPQFMAILIVEVIINHEIVFWGVPFGKLT
jgi:hypothetical protein